VVEIALLQQNCWLETKQQLPCPFPLKQGTNSLTPPHGFVQEPFEQANPEGQQVVPQGVSPEGQVVTHCPLEHICAEEQQFVPHAVVPDGHVVVVHEPLRQSPDAGQQVVPQQV
jgi:hypothetical protein